MPAEHLKKTTWDRFEVIVIENNSTDPATFAYTQKASAAVRCLKVVTYPGKGFNFSAINNFGRKRQRRPPAAAQQRCGSGERRLAHGAAPAVRPPRRRGDLRCHALVPG